MTETTLDSWVDDLQRHILRAYQLDPLDVNFKPGTTLADVWLPGPKMPRRPKRLRTPAWLHTKAKRSAARAARRQNRA